MFIALAYANEGYEKKRFFRFVEDWGLSDFHPLNSARILKVDSRIHANFSFKNMILNLT